MSAPPAAISAAARWLACCADPHCASTVVHAVVKPRRSLPSHALRVTFEPCSPACVTQPPITSSTSAGSIPARSITASCAARRISGAFIPASQPLRFPIGVRTASTMTGVPMSDSSLQVVVRRPSLESVLVLATSSHPHPSDPDAPASEREPSVAARAGQTAWVERVHNLYDPDALPEHVAASRRAAEAARRVVAALVAPDADATALDDAAAALDAIAATLTRDGTPRIRSRYEATEGLRGGVDAASQVWESHPFLGHSHPIAPPLKVIREGDHSIALVTYTHVYE